MVLLEYCWYKDLEILVVMFIFMCCVEKYYDENLFQIINIILHIFNKEIMKNLDKEPIYNTTWKILKYML